MDTKNDSHLLTEHQGESLEACTRRLSRRLSEYEVTCIETEGKAKQLRKERDVERSLNEKLRKEVDKLSNQLLRERTRVSCLEKEVKTLTAQQKDEEKIDGESKNVDETISSKESDLENTQKPLQQQAQNLLTSKLQELKSAIEDRMDRQGSNQENEDQFIALSILIQSLQDYMEIERENKEINQENTGDVADGEPRINERPVITNGRSKRELSMWFKILVYLGPVFLSVLCYIAFNTGKK